MDKMRYRLSDNDIAEPNSMPDTLIKAAFCAIVLMSYVIDMDAKNLNTFRTIMDFERI